MLTYNRHVEGFEVTVLGSERPMLYYKMRAEWRWSTFHPPRHPVLHDSNPWQRKQLNKGKIMCFLVMYVTYQELLYHLSLQNMRARWLSLQSPLVSLI